MHRCGRMLRSAPPAGTSCQQEAWLEGCGGWLWLLACISRFIQRWQHYMHRLSEGPTYWHPCSWSPSLSTALQGAWGVGAKHKAVGSMPKGRAALAELCPNCSIKQVAGTFCESREGGRAAGAKN